MKKILAFLYNYQSLLYKGFLYVVSCFFVIYLFPVKSQFAYEFSEGELWAYETLYAPFDFAIIKTAEEIQLEKEELRNEVITFFDVDQTIETKVIDNYSLKFSKYFPFSKSSSRYKVHYQYGISLLTNIYQKGVLPINYQHKGGESAALIIDRSETDLPFVSLLNLNELSTFLEINMAAKFKSYEKSYYNLFFEILEPNLSYNASYSDRSFNALYETISPTRGLVRKGEVIISTNETIENKKWIILDSLRQQFSSESLSPTNYRLTLLGYGLMVGLLMLILFIFIYKYRMPIFENNTKMTFIFFNVLIMVLLSTTVIKFNATYLYALPICIFPLIIKTFFDARLGLFIHVLTVIMIGFIAPNSYEYVVLQILAGIVTILGASELYKRANLFITVFQITLVYLLSYSSFILIRVVDLESLDYLVFGLFLINGLLTLFVQPLIYLYEKIFKLVSDVSLLELSDMNSVVFKELSNKAPGTFHHSLQVANLAEAAANAINANALLTRVGALYHDIGKMNRPTFFSENQRGSISPHDDLSPVESAGIIIGHVLEGIEMARKYNLPDRVIDFIRTHHGTSKVYYFYKKQQEISDEVDEKMFTYLGPKPFSKETAIVMMADAVEAASKSLKEPTIERLESFVTRIINQQMEDKQFVQSDITFAEIETVKKVLTSKLINVYHLRIEYPD